MKLKQPVRGIHIGGCVDGSPFPKDVGAHAHVSGSTPTKFVGYICAKSKRDLTMLLFHELAHLAADTGHDDRWRKQLKSFGVRIPAANRKKPRRTP